MSGFNGYLRRNRYGIYAYRRVLPEPVRASFGGRSEFIRSLSTRNRRDAILLAQHLNLQVEESIRAALDQPMPKHRIDYTCIVKIEPDGSETHTLDVTPEDVKAWQAAGLTPEQIATLLKPGNSGQRTTQAVTNNPTISLGALFKRFTDDLVGRKKPDWRPPKNYETYQRRLIEILGDRPIDEVSRADARKARQTLQALPANTARHKGKTIPEILTFAVDGPKFAERNINNHLEYYDRVFGWATSEGLLPGQNPFNEIRVEASKGDGMSRDLFTLLELKKIFGTDLYTNYGANPTHKPYRFWLPLLLLTSGARRAEIAGLYLEDIRQDGRTWIIDINSKQPDKRLKTANAARVIPIHPEILNLGFIDYVNKLKKRNEVRLFPELKTLSDTDGYARPFGDWFSEYLKELGIYEKRKKTAHSFRHTHATMLQDAGVAIQRIEELQGRTFTEQTVGQTHYLHGTSIENLAKDVKLLNFSTILAGVRCFG